MSAIRPTLPKGTRDFLPEQMVRRQFVFDTIKTIFEKYGYEPLETPSIEKLDVLSGKYGDEGEQLLFKVLRRGTGLEQLQRGRQEFVVREYSQLVEEALRYDLTVPLSRVVAMHQNELILPFKRYQIQPVWRADRPQRGRYREFYQCDIDTVGTKSMLADAEAIAVVHEVLATLGFENFSIRINNRKVLNGLLIHAGIAPEAGDAVFVVIDKLDKIGLAGVKSELEKLGLSGKQVDKVLSVLQLSGESDSVLSELKSTLKDSEALAEGVDELRKIVTYLNAMGIPESHYKIDLYLVRGLSYYTGPIHESVIEEPKMGSLTGGGRYDCLIGMFLGRDIAATGTAFGVERIIDVMTQLEMFPESQNSTQVLVTQFDDSTVEASLGYVQLLRGAGIAAEFYFEAAKMKKQLSYANKKAIPYVAFVGPDEVTKNQVTLKDMRSGDQQTLAVTSSLEMLKKKICGPGG